MARTYAVKRLLIVATALFLATGSGSPAYGIDEGNEGNSRITIPNPAYVHGDLWADSQGAYLVATRQNSCWYPQEWYDDVAILDIDGNVVGYDQGSIYYSYVVDQLRADPNWFAPIDPFGANSCIQSVFLARGDCSTDDQIAVLSTAAAYDARIGRILQRGDFDLHDIAGLYCLVVIERDPWLQRIEDQALVPQPVRATFPSTRTLVGLANRTWYDVADDDNRTTDGFDLDLPTAGADYHLTLEIWLTRIQVDVDGDGAWDFTKTCPDPDAELLDLCAGSLDDPVYTFEYETRAFHPFTIQTNWGGRATDDAGNVLDIDPSLLRNAATFDWETVEVRSSLDG
jgi:hypothetical protein